MNKNMKVITAVVLALALTACGDKADTKPSVTPTMPSGGIDAPGFERTMMNAEREVTGEKYEHGDDGYFLLADNGIKTELKMQKGARTGWAFAASTSMETAAFLNDKKEIKIDPFDILKTVYTEDKKEGIFSESGNYLVVSGHGRYIADALSNGFNNGVLSYAKNCENLTPEQIKEEIKTHGAMTMGIKETHNGRGFNDGYFTQYDKNNIGDHIVAVVGWDDHFPKEIFAKTHFVETPSQDGGWIVQDSLNNSDYVYISYDTKLVDTYIFGLSDEYSRVDTYDGGCEGKIKTGQTTELKNIFHREGTLKAVGTFVPSDGESVEIKVFDEKTDKLLAEQAQTFNARGYYTVPLKEAVEVKDYRIEITYDKEAPVEGEKWSDGFVKYLPKIGGGQSYVKIGKKWYDLADKATKKKLGIDFKPNNACIKALF